MRYENYVVHSVRCDTCDFEESVSSIQMRCAGVKFDYSNGDDCAEVFETISEKDGKRKVIEHKCEGHLIVSNSEVSKEEHKENYLNYLQCEGDNGDR
jgi:hypothetical protein